jgi:hypothetical protein
VLQHVNDEAVCDQILEQLAKVRVNAKAREWPSRFGDIHGQAAVLLKSAESPHAD